MCGRLLSNFIINCPKVVQLPFSPALRTFPPIHYTCSLAHYMGNNPSWGVSQNLYTQLVLLLFGGIILVRVLARDHLATIYFVDSVWWSSATELWIMYPYSTFRIVWRPMLSAAVASCFVDGCSCLLWASSKSGSEGNRAKTNPLEALTWWRTKPFSSPNPQPPFSCLYITAFKKFWT